MRSSLLHSLSILALGAALAACDGAAETTGTTTTTEAPLDIPDDPDCDPIVPEVCAMPFPSTRWLKKDPARATGYTLSFGPTTLPANEDGVHVDPAPYARLDGFGVGVPA